MNKAYKIWWCFWGLCLIGCLAHYAYCVCTMQDTGIISIEHKYYLWLIALAGVSMTKIPYVKSIVFFYVFINAFDLYGIPENDTLLTMQYCYEDNICDEAFAKQYLKVENDRYVYIPRKDRKPTTELSD